MNANILAHLFALLAFIYITKNVSTACPDIGAQKALTVVAMGAAARLIRARLNSLKSSFTIAAEACA